MPGLASMGAPALEGEYSHWTIHDIFQDPDVYTLGLWGQFVVVSRDDRVALIVDAQAGKVKTYTIATKTLSAPIVSDIIIGWGGEAREFYSSAYGTYAVINEDYRYVKIVKKGVVMTTFSDTELGFVSSEILTVSISPSGKYVFISGPFAAGGKGWVVLEGS